MNSYSIPFDRHKRITLLFLKYQTLRSVVPDEQSARSLAQDMENLGAPFVKAARLLSLRGDMLPKTVMDAFSNLDETRFRNEPQTAESMETIDQVLEDEIGKKALRAFASFHPEPFRFSGTGQVHRACLHDGREVCVRIQRPQVRQKIVKDLDTLAEIAAFIDHPSGRGTLHRFSRFADRLRVTIMRELDYRREETALIELHHKLDAYSKILVPIPHSEYCSSRVLTTEFIEGKEIWEIPSRWHEHSRELAVQFLNGYLDQIFSYGLVHPQPHLENLLITDHGELVITEASGMLKIGATTRSILSHLLYGICTKDPKITSNAALRLGHPNSESISPDVDEFTLSIQTALHADSLAGRFRDIAQASATCGRPFSMEVCRLADLLDGLSVSIEAIHPQYDVSAHINHYLRDQLEEERENFPRALSPMG